MASGPNKRRAARKKKNKKKKKNKNVKASSSNHPAEKVFAEAEAVSEMVTSENEENESSGSVVTEVNEGRDVGESSYHDPATLANTGEKFSRDPTAMADPVLSDGVANGDQLSLESDLEALSLRLLVNPLHEQLHASSTILCGAEKVADDAVLSGSVSNVFLSETIAVGDVIAQPVFEVVLNENEANESPESGDNQTTFHDEVKVQKSLIKTSKEAGRTEPFEYVDHQVSLNKSIIGPTSLIKSSSNETEGNDGGDVGISSCHPTTMANLVESDVADGDQISPESALDVKASSTISPAETKVAADVELFQSVSNALKYSVVDLHAVAVSEMCLNENSGRESNDSVSQKFINKTISNKVETNESSESVITDEVVLEETSVETTLKKADACDPSESVDEQIVYEEPLVEPFISKTKKCKSLEFVSDRNILQESLIETTLSKADITECGEMSLESALESLSLRSPAHPPHEHIKGSSTVLLTERVAADVKLSEIVAAEVVLSGSVSNVFVSEMIVDDVIAQPVSEIGSNEGNESPESVDNQNAFQELMFKASSIKTKRNEACDTVVSDEVKLQKSLIKTSKEAERNEPFESVDHQISFDKSITGSTSLIQSTLNKTEGNEGGDVGKSSCHPTTLANLVESEVANGDQISPERALDGVFIKASSTIRPAEKKVAGDVGLIESVSNASKYSVGDLHAEAVSQMSLKENGVSQKFLIKTISYTDETTESSVDGQIVLEERVVGDQNNLQESLIEPTLSKADITECGEMSIESALESLSLRSPAHPPLEHINEGETVMNDEVKLKESLIKTSKMTGRNESFETVDHQISLDKSVPGPTSYETEGNEDGDVGKSFYPNPVVSDVTNGDQISPANALEGVAINASSTIPPAEKKVAADVELFQSVINASEISVGNLNAEAVSEMCSKENEGPESNEGHDQMNSKFLSISNTDETNESSESVITDEVALEETLVETTSKIAEAYDPSKYVDEKTVIEEPLVESFINKTEICKSLEFVSDQNNLQESLTETTLSKADITECGETFSHAPTATASQFTTGDQISLECALGGPSLKQQVHPLPEPPKRPRRNIKRPSWYDDYIM